MNKNKTLRSKILIVDDAPKNLQFLVNILKKEGFQLSVAQSGEQSLAMVKKITPDLILLDVRMPNMSGFEVCTILKNSPITKDIPVIFLTALVEVKEIVKGFELGAVDYITKPFSVEVLLARVKTHLELKHSKELTLELNKEVKELLHVLCHDISNPLTGTLNMLEFLEKNSDDFDKWRSMMTSYIKKGLEIIDLVRSLSRLDDKNIRLDIKPINLANAVEMSYDIISQLFHKKNISFERDISKNIYVQAEHTSLVNSVLSNILTNSVKFSFPDSQVHLKINEKPDCIEIAIQDHGIGMPESLIHDIFDVKKSTSRKGTNGELGTGYGMPLVKKFILFYGGDITISSHEKTGKCDTHGTEVVIRLKK